MLNPGSLLPMIRSEIPIFDLTDRFYGMKNFTYVFWNRLWQFHGFLLTTIDIAHLIVVTRHETCQVIEIYRRKTVFSPRKNEFDILCLTGVCSFFSNIQVWKSRGIPEHISDDQEMLKKAMKIKERNP